MLRRPATQITLTPSDLADFEIRHNHRLAEAAAARQAKLQRERDERLQRERLELARKEAGYVGASFESSVTEQDDISGFAQGSLGSQEEGVFVTPTASTRNESDAASQGTRMDNMRNRRRAAAAAASAAAQSVNANRPAPPLFRAERAATREDRIMGVQRGDEDFGSGASLGQTVPGAPSRPRR